MGQGFFVSWKTHVVYSIIIFELDGFCTHLYMAITMTAVRMTARTTRMAMRKLRFMFKVERAPTNSMSQCS